MSHEEIVDLLERFNQPYGVKSIDESGYRKKEGRHLAHMHAQPVQSMIIVIMERLNSRE